MTVHSLGQYRRKRDEALEPTNLDKSPIGRFAVGRTRDVNALARDGELVYAIEDPKLTRRFSHLAAMPQKLTQPRATDGESLILE